MTNVEYEGKLFKVSEKLSTHGSKYDYSPVSSDCMACAVRVTSRRHKELEEQKSVVVCGPFPSSEDVCHLPKTLAKEKYRRAQLHVVTTNQRVKVFGKWTEEKLLAVLTDRLLQRAASQPPKPYEKIPPLKIKQFSAGIPYSPIVHRGIYSKNILGRLYRSGASESLVIRAMKFGLRHLKPEDLNYFIEFGVSIQALRSHKLWNELTDESLATSLRTMGFDEKASRKIILNGMLAQSEMCLMQLMLAGVDVPGILNWQGEKIDVGARMIKFLRNLGIPEDVLQLIVQKGIDEETMEMLKDLGYMETEEEENVGMHEVIICECDLTVLESEISSVNSPHSNTNSFKSLIPKSGSSEADFEAGDTCVCSHDINSSTMSNSTSSQQTLVYCKNVHITPKTLTSSELVTERNEYLRRTVVAPLAWAMSRALQYRPSDPNHYIACQLLRWRYGNVSKTEMKTVEDYVIARTIEMDKKLMEQKRKEEEELMAKHNLEALQNIPCSPCWQNQQIHRIKERCWKCIKKWVPNYETCELPEICSSCKIDLSEISNSDTTTSSTGNNSDTQSAVQAQEVTISENKSITLDDQYRCTQNLDLSSYNRVVELYGESLNSDSYEENMQIISSTSEP